MSQESSQDYVSNEVEGKHASISTEGGEDSQLNEETIAVNSKIKNGMYNVQHLVVKKEIVTDDDSDGEEYFIFPDDMEMVEISGDSPYLRAALTTEDPNGENTSHFILVGASSKSNAFVASGNNDQVNSEDESPLYIDLSAPKKKHKGKIQKKRLDFSKRFNLKNVHAEGTVGNKIDDYDSEIVIYPVQDNLRNIESNTMYLKNTCSITRKFDKDNENNHTYEISNCTRLLAMQDTGRRVKSIHKDDTHPFKCEECGESFELKRHFEMHELGHEKYKFYSFRTNTIRCICVQCKKPYLYSANDKEPTSNICAPCLLKLREKMTDYNTDKGKESGTRQLFHFPDVRNPPKVPMRKQCYSCGTRSDRYFVYGASLLCSQCWQDRLHRAKRGYRSLHRSLQRGSYQRHNSTAESPFKSEVAHMQCKHPEEKPNLIGTHFLLSTFNASPVNEVEETDDDFQEIREDWRETEIPAHEDKSGSSTVILCDKTGEFIDINCCV